MAQKSQSLIRERLRTYLIAQRRKAGLRQVDLAKRLRRYQSYVTYVETGQKIVDVAELIEWAEAIGFDPVDAIKHVMRKRGE
jgi:ribosome-binding protein aMBF1 (putative translation factor)